MGAAQSRLDRNSNCKNPLLTSETACPIGNTFFHSLKFGAGFFLFFFLLLCLRLTLLAGTCCRNGCKWKGLLACIHKCQWRFPVIQVTVVPKVVFQKTTGLTFFFPLKTFHFSSKNFFSFNCMVENRRIYIPCSIKSHGI